MNKSFQIGIYGPKESGKSSFVMRFFDNHFDSFYIPSIETEKRKKQTYLKFEKVDVEFTVYTDNQKEISLNESIFIFFDVANYRSFIEARDFIQANPILKRKKFFLIGNKSDLKVNSKIKNEINLLLPKYPNSQYFEVSIMNNIGITPLMNKCSDFFY